MRIPLAVLMFAHGVAHLVGFVASWRLAPLEGITYKTTVLAGRVDLGDVGIRAVGLGWLLAAVAFWIVAVAAAMDQAWWVPAAVTVAIASAALSVLGWPDSRIGVYVNAAILLALVGFLSWR